MPLTNCPDCEKEVSDSAPSCPNCGCPIADKSPPKIGLYGPGVGQQTKKKSKLLVVIVGFFIFCWIVYFVAIVSENEEQESALSNTDSSEWQKNITQEIEIIDVDYMILFQDYENNAISADKEYKDKLLRVTGEVDEIYREISGNPYITFIVEGQYFANIRLTFKKSEEDNIANLTKGETVIVVGKCTGKSPTGTVTLNDCYLE